MNLSENIGPRGNRSVSTAGKLRQALRDLVMPALLRTTKNYQKVSAKISTLVSIEVKRAGLFVNMKLNYPNAL
jgi:hypothetical protein